MVTRSRPRMLGNLDFCSVRSLLAVTPHLSKYLGAGDEEGAAASYYAACWTHQRALELTDVTSLGQIWIGICGRPTRAVISVRRRFTTSCVDTLEQRSVRPYHRICSAALRRQLWLDAHRTRYWQHGTCSATPESIRPMPTIAARDPLMPKLGVQRAPADEALLEPRIVRARAKLGEHAYTAVLKRAA